MNSPIASHESYNIGSHLDSFLLPSFREHDLKIRLYFSNLDIIRLFIFIEKY